jgi:hypothetical protein
MPLVAPYMLEMERYVKSSSFHLMPLSQQSIPKRDIASDIIEQVHTSSRHIPLTSRRSTRLTRRISVPTPIRDYQRQAH